MSKLSECLDLLWSRAQNPYVEEVFQCRDTHDIRLLCDSHGLNYYIEHPPMKVAGVWDDVIESFLELPSGVLKAVVDTKGKPYICGYFRTLSDFQCSR